MKALVLEDDVIQTIFFKQQSKNIDCQFKYVPSVNAAKKSLNEGGFDICFVDLSLPNEDGYDLIKYIAKHLNDNVAVVLVSGISDELLINSKFIGEQLGISNIKYIKKPVTSSNIQGFLDWCENIEYKKHNPIRKVSYSDVSKIDLDKYLIPHYQPIVCSETLKIVKVEALARIRHDTLSNVSPELFISIFESLGMNFTEKMIEKSLIEYSKFRFINPALGVSINLTHQDLINKRLIEKLLYIVSNLNLEPSKITIEVSEKNLGVSFNEILISICRLKIEGFVISMDDFGIGDSTISNLLDSSFDELKIDKKFAIRSIHNDKFRVALNSIINFAKDLGLSVVCEGIENYNQLIESKKCGPVLLQGFYFSKPVNFNTIKRILEEGGSIKKY